jgi:hypothetical protein
MGGPAAKMLAAEAVAATEMTAGKVMAATVTSTMAAASAKCRARQYGREHNDGNYST